MTTSALDISFEFFPPRSDSMAETLRRTVAQLETLEARFCSVTDGAGGSGGDLTRDVVKQLRRDSRLEVAAHMACVGRSAKATENLARDYWRSGVRRIVALRGDPREDVAERHHPGPYRFAADLVAGLKRIADFDISVAAYPEPHPDSRGRKQDLEHLQRKFDAGATRAITQYFFDAECFLRLRDDAARAGIDAPIVPGILPVHDLDRVRDFSRRCGATVPARFGPLFARAGDDPAARYRLAVDLAVELCESLRREGVGQIHFYTLNQSDLCLDISLALGANHTARPVESAA